MRSPTSIRFTESRAKSSIEWVEYRSKQLPAPGDYSPKRPSTSGGAFSNAKPKSDLDWTILRAKQTPAADAYNLSNGCFNGTSGGRFSTAYPKSYLELEEYRSKQLPSPAAYRVSLVVIFFFGLYSKQERTYLNSLCSLSYFLFFYLLVLCFCVLKKKSQN